LTDAPLADPGVRNYRTGLLRNARRWNFDHDWFLVVGRFHTGCGWLCRAGNGKGSSAVLGIGICQRSHTATKVVTLKLLRWLRRLSHLQTINFAQ
jgi:hypothetical protein